MYSAEMPAKRAMLRIGTEVSSLFLEAQKTTLASLRVLDHNGTVIGGRDEVGVQRALANELGPVPFVPQPPQRAVLRMDGDRDRPGARVGRGREDGVAVERREVAGQRRRRRLAGAGAEEPGVIAEAGVVGAFNA